MIFHIRVPLAIVPPGGHFATRFSPSRKEEIISSAPLWFKNLDLLLSFRLHSVINLFPDSVQFLLAHFLAVLQLITTHESSLTQHMGVASLAKNSRWLSWHLCKRAWEAHRVGIWLAYSAWSCGNGLFELLWAKFPCPALQQQIVARVTH